MNSNQSAPALPSTLCKEYCCVTQADCFPFHSYMHMCADSRKRGKVEGNGAVFSTRHPLAKATEAVGVKVPPVEKETEQSRQFTSQSLSRGVQKQPPLLSNHTPHGKVFTKTQNEHYYRKEWQGSPPPNCSSKDRGGDDGAPESHKAVSSVLSSPEQAVNHPTTHDLEVGCTSHFYLHACQRNCKELDKRLTCG